jgi:Mn2+/Fe2+ NRAMP family transporter
LPPPFAYVAALLAAEVNWTAAVTGMLLPRITWNADFFTTLVAILGTTISPLSVLLASLAGGRRRQGEPGAKATHTGAASGDGCVSAHSR